MKTTPKLISRALGACTALAVCALALPYAAEAKAPDKRQEAAAAAQKKPASAPTVKRAAPVVVRKVAPTVKRAAPAVAAKPAPTVKRALPAVAAKAKPTVKRVEPAITAKERTSLTEVSRSTASVQQRGSEVAMAKRPALAQERSLTTSKQARAHVTTDTKVASTANPGVEETAATAQPRLAGEPQRRAIMAARRSGHHSLNKEQETQALAQRREANASLWTTPQVRTVYDTYPRTGYVLTLGNGYAGPGYYYGPPDAPYFYENPGVRFFRSRSLIPFDLFGPEWMYPAGLGYGGDDAAFMVQEELANRGYYNGPIDGVIGPGTRRAIMRYQADVGLYPTGRIDGELLRALRIE